MFASSILRHSATRSHRFIFRPSQHLRLLERSANIGQESRTMATSLKASDGGEKDDRVSASLKEISKLVFVGGGKMAEAMIGGLLRQGILKKKRLHVVDPNAARLELFDSMGLPVYQDVTDAVNDADVIVFSVKPQSMDEVLQDLHGRIREDALLLSIAAGITKKAFKDRLGEGTRVVRSMPNTPAMVGHGMTVWTCAESLSKDQRLQARGILQSFGDELYVESEDYIDMATAISGTGPAYFFLVAEAMIDTGVHLGFPRAVAEELTLKTMLGSAHYILESKKHPTLLRNDITSPGGTTAAALYRAEKNGFRSVLADSIWAAYERCVELGQDEPVIRKRPRG